jgi:hypothetical protein
MYPTMMMVMMAFESIICLASLCFLTLICFVLLLCARLAWPLVNDRHHQMLVERTSIDIDQNERVMMTMLSP